MRIRTVKPEFFTHEALFDAEKATKLPLRVAFVGLWCAADREGRFRWEPRRLGVQILPYDGVDFARVLDALATRGFVVRYASQHGEIGWIPSFTRHQVINNRESDSSLPAPDEETLKTLALLRVPHACPTCAGRGCDACEGEGKGREGNKEGKEGERRFAPPTREELDLAAAKLGMASVEVDKFVAYYGSNGWRVGKNPMKSWQHALTRWHITSNEHSHARTGGAGHGGPTPAERRNSTLDPRDVAAVRANAEASAERDRRKLEEDPDWNPFYSR